MDYWPAVCMVWTDNSWFGDTHHEIALMYEIFFMGFLGFVVNVAARIYGEYDWDLEIFTPSRFALRSWLDQEIERLQKKHPSFSGTSGTYPGAQREAMIAQWEIAKRKQIEQLMQRRQQLLP